MTTHTKSKDYAALLTCWALLMHSIVAICSSTQYTPPSLGGRQGILGGFSLTHSPWNRLSCVHSTWGAELQLGEGNTLGEGQCIGFHSVMQINQNQNLHTPRNSWQLWYQGSMTRTGIRVIFWWLFFRNSWSRYTPWGHGLLGKPW